MICFNLINRELFRSETSFPRLRKGVFLYSCGELLTRGLNSGKRKPPLFFLDPPSPPRFTDVANGKIDYSSLKTPLGKQRPRLHQESYQMGRAGIRGREMARRHPWERLCSETACRLDTNIDTAIGTGIVDKCLVE